MDERQRHAWNWLGLGPQWQSIPKPGSPSDAPPLEGSGHRAGQPGPELAGAIESAPPLQASASSREDAIRLLEWDALRETVASCRACALCETRKQTVFGVGARRASCLVIGEAPGAQEDERGEPFVGPAGQLLDNMLAAIGLSRERDVFIANVLKCRPPGNRDPQPVEVERCAPFLARQIALLSPRIIVVMGRFAAQSLLRTDASIANLRGRIHTYRDAGLQVPVIVSYHPAYLLRSPLDKAKAWSDLCRAREALLDERDAAPSR